MAKRGLNVDISVQRRWGRWEQREAKRDWRSPDGYTENIGRVVVRRDSLVEDWAYSDTIVVKDRRSKATLLTFVGPDRPNGAYHFWRLWAGVPRSETAHQVGFRTFTTDEQIKPTPDWLAYWEAHEFEEAFSPITYRQSLDACLALIRCPSCPSWTGGGLCISCARKATLALYRSLDDG